MKSLSQILVVVFLLVTPTLAFADGDDDQCKTPQSSHAEVVKAASAVQEITKQGEVQTQPLVQAQPLIQIPTGRTANPEISVASSFIKAETASKPTTKPTPSIVSRFVPSIVATTLASSVIYPLDQLKVRLQNGTVSNVSLATESAEKTYARPASAGLFSQVKDKLIQAYGHYDPQKGTLNYVRNNIYKGYAPYLTVMSTSTGIVYPLHDVLQRPIWDSLPASMSPEERTRYSNIAAGAAATGVSQVVNIPQFNYRTNQSLADLEGGKKYTPSGFVKEAIKNPKIATKGLAMAPAYSASMATYYYLFDTFKKQKLAASNQTSSSELSLFNTFLASSQARLLVSVGIHPFDTLRIRKQKTDLSYPTIAKEFIKENGVKRFYKGLPISMLRNSMSTGISMALYQKIKYAWEKQNAPKSSP